ncbi:hypothetical protein [Streptomyces sp. cg35]|uniref:hypothetical protein n=1 Tax=Streptomyces sp. cg35 TaxID=3421650 RepID=UPI003D178D5C
MAPQFVSQLSLPEESEAPDVVPAVVQREYDSGHPYTSITSVLEHQQDGQWYVSHRTERGFVESLYKMSGSGWRRCTRRYFLDGEPVEKDLPYADFMRAFLSGEEEGVPVLSPLRPVPEQWRMPLLMRQVMGLMEAARSRAADPKSVTIEFGREDFELETQPCYALVMRTDRGVLQVRFHAFRRSGTWQAMNCQSTPFVLVDSDGKECTSLIRSGTEGLTWLLALDGEKSAA